MDRKPAMHADALPTFEILFENSFRVFGELYPGLAPNTVGRFISLANSGFYDGASICLVAPDGIVLIDDPGKTLSDRIRGECTLNGCEYNKGKVCAGSLCFFHSTHYDSGRSAFFIVLNNQSRTVRMVEGAYALFGQVLEGLPFAQVLSRTECDEKGIPTNIHRIRSIRVETYGREFPFETIPEPQSTLDQIILNNEADIDLSFEADL